MLASTDVVDSSEYLAYLRSRSAAVLQPQVEGQVVGISVKAGDHVEPGQPLLQIDPNRQQATVNQAQASRASRQAALELARINLARTETLVSEGALARQELDNALATERSAHADVDALGAEIKAGQVQLGYYTVAAPYRGTVGDIPVRVGDRVTTPTVLTSITDNTVLEANISIPVIRAKDVALGTEIRLADADGNTLATAPVGFVSPVVNLSTQSVLVKAYIDNAAGALRSDQLVRSNVVWRHHPGVVVPPLAVTRLGGQAFVYVVEDGHAKQRPVTLGELVDNKYPVIKGVAAGDTVVTSQIQKLRDGAAIKAK
jgi:RND family efflux transporter MFP subunit